MEHALDEDTLVESDVEETGVVVVADKVLRRVREHDDPLPTYLPTCTFFYPSAYTFQVYTLFNVPQTYLSTDLNSFGSFEFWHCSEPGLDSVGIHGKIPGRETGLGHQPLPSIAVDNQETANPHSSYTSTFMTDQHPEIDVEGTILAPGLELPDIVLMKEYARYMARSRVGKLGDRISVRTMATYIVTLLLYSNNKPTGRQERLQQRYVKRFNIESIAVLLTIQQLAPGCSEQPNNSRTEHPTPHPRCCEQPSNPQVCCSNLEHTTPHIRTPHLRALRATSTGRPDDSKCT
jgi:hypothetical protein